jgi:hypothetical protein
MLKDLTINTPNRQQELEKKKGRRFSSLITKLERKSYNKNEKGLSEISLGSGKQYQRNTQRRLGVFENAV